MTEKYYVLSLNAEPWAVGSLGVTKKGNKMIPYMSPNQKLQAFQEAVREQLTREAPTEGEVEVRIFVWRCIEELVVTSGRNRKAKTSDATNIQKGLEDALQGVLIENDRNVRKISTEIIQQDENATPCIVICVKPYDQGEFDLPSHVWDRVDVATFSPRYDETLFSLPETNVEDHF